MLGLELGGVPVRGRFVRQRRDAGTHPRLDGVVGDVLQRLDRGLGGVGGLDGARDRLARLLDQALGGVLLRDLVGRRVVRLELGLHGIRGLRGGARLGEGRLGVLIGRGRRGLRLGRRLGCRRGDLQRLIGLGGRVGHRGLHLAEIRGDLFDRGLRPVQFRREIGGLLRHRIHIGTHARHGILHILKFRRRALTQGVHIGTHARHGILHILKLRRRALTQGVHGLLGGVGTLSGGVGGVLGGLEIGLGLLTDGVDGRLDLSGLGVHLVETVVDAVDLLLGLFDAGLHLFEKLVLLGLLLLDVSDRLLVGVRRLLGIVGGVLRIIGLVRGVVGHLLDFSYLNRLILGRLVERGHGVKRGIDSGVQASQETRLLAGQAVVGLADDVLALAGILEIECDRVDHEELVGVVDGRTDTHGVAHVEVRVPFHEQREIHGLDVQRDLRFLGLVELLDAGLHEIVDVRDGGVLEDLLLVAVAFHGGGGVEHITGLEDVGIERADAVRNLFQSDRVLGDLGVALDLGEREVVQIDAAVSIVADIVEVPARTDLRVLRQIRLEVEGELDPLVALVLHSQRGVDVHRRPAAGLLVLVASPDRDVRPAFVLHIDRGLVATSRTRIEEAVVDVFSGPRDEI